MSATKGKAHLLIRAGDVRKDPERTLNPELAIAIVCWLFALWTLSLDRIRSLAIFRVVPLMSEARVGYEKF
jgi:hypothetical protein